MTVIIAGVILAISAILPASATVRQERLTSESKVTPVKIPQIGSQICSVNPDNTQIPPSPPLPPTWWW